MQNFNVDKKKGIIIKHVLLEKKSFKYDFDYVQNLYKMK